MQENTHAIAKLPARNPLYHIAIIILLAALSYSNTFDVPFVLDDNFIIKDNPIVKDLGYFLHPSRAEALKEHFEYRTFLRRYVGYLTFAINHSLHGTDVKGYHAFNLLVHVVNALLIYSLVALTFRAPLLNGSALRDHRHLIALFSALLFAVHPVQTQAVTYIWQRVTSLAATFYVCSLLLYVMWRLNSAQLQGASSLRRHLPFIGALAAAVAAMKTKEIAFTLPLTIAMYEFMFFAGDKRKRILYLLPFIATMSIIPMSVLTTGGAGEGLASSIFTATKEQTDMPRSVYLFTEFRVIVTYLRLFLFPINLNLDYDYPLSHGFLNLGVILSLLIILAVMSAAVYFISHSKRTDPAGRVIAFGVLAFFLSLSVESSVIPIVDVIFEHRAYLPNAWMLISATSLAFLVASRAKGQRALLWLIAALALVSLLFAIGTFHRNSVWRDGITLWQDTVRKSPNKGRPHATLGKAYQDRGLIQFAIAEYEAARRLDPELTEARSNLGAAYAMTGQYEKAVSALEEAIRIDPRSSGSYSNLGNIYFILGKPDMALQNYRRALELDPASPEPRFNLVRLLLSLGRHSEAEEELGRLRAVRPDLADKIAGSPAYRNR